MRRRQIIVALLHQHAHRRVPGHGGGEINGGVGDQRFLAVGQGVQPVPALENPARDGVVAVFPETQVVVVIVHESRLVGGAHGGVEGVVLHVVRDAVDAAALEARVDPANGDVLVAQQFLGEAGVGHAQIGIFPVLFAQAGVAREFANERFPLRGRQRGAFHQRGGVFLNRESLHFLDERHQVVRPLRDGVVIPGGRRQRWQIQRVWQIDGEAVARGGGIHERGNQNHAIESHAVIREQFVGHAAGADAAIALPQHVLRRVPAVVLGEVIDDELGGDGDVGVHPPEILRPPLALDGGVARSHRVHHHQVGDIEHAEFIVDGAIGRRAGHFDIVHRNASRAEHPHMQPDRRRTRAAVVSEQQRTTRAVLAVAHIGGVAEQADALAGLVADQVKPGGGGVVDRAAIDLHAVPGRNRFGLRRGGVFAIRGRNGIGRGERRGAQQRKKQREKQRKWHQQQLLHDRPSPRKLGSRGGESPPPRHLRHNRKRTPAKYRRPSTSYSEISTFASPASEKPSTGGSSSVKLSMPA